MALKLNELQESAAKERSSASRGEAHFGQMPRTIRALSGRNGVTLCRGHDRKIFHNNPRGAHSCCQRSGQKKALLNKLDNAVAQRKSVSVQYLSFGGLGEKIILDKYPAAKFSETSSTELVNNCKEAFVIKRNRT